MIIGGIRVIPDSALPPGTVAWVGKPIYKYVPRPAKGGGMILHAVPDLQAMAREGRLLIMRGFR